MNFFQSILQNPFVAGLEHMFGYHGSDPWTGSHPAAAASPSPPPGLNLAQFNGLQGTGPAHPAAPINHFAPPSAAPVPTAQPSMNPTPMPSGAPQAGDPYQSYLQGLQVQPSPGLPTPPPDLRQAVSQVSRQQGVPSSILYGISGAESVNPQTNQWQNALGTDQHGQGYFQFDNRYYPHTAQFNPYDPYQAATQAAQKFKGDVNYFQQHPTNGYGPVEAAMRAYNAGRGGNLGAITPSQDYNRFKNYVGLNK